MPLCFVVPSGKHVCDLWVETRNTRFEQNRAAEPPQPDLSPWAHVSPRLARTMVRELANGGFLAEQRNAVLIGGTGTGKSHLAIAIARACIRGGARGRFYNVVDLVNRLESEARSGRQGRMADFLSRPDLSLSIAGPPAASTTYALGLQRSPVTMHRLRQIGYEKLHFALPASRMRQTLARPMLSLSVMHFT